MKVFLENFNGILDTVEDYLDEHNELTNNYHEADCFLLWQDVRGVWRELAIVAKEMGKPVIVMQHGRGATRDYGPPNNFKLLADKILVWGESEKERLVKFGVSLDKIVVVGCPLLPRLKIPRQERQGKNILFAPVIAQKEEPENLLVFHALKIWEAEHAIKTITKHFVEMKKAWAWQNDEYKEVVLPDGTKERRLWKRDIKGNLPRWLTYEDGLINVKLTSVHDTFQYQAPLVVTNQNDPVFMDGLIQLLTNIDAVVCLEEGTMQLLAHAMGIPVVLVDIFNYQNYGGCADYDKVEKIKTKACYFTTNISKIGSILDHALANPLELARQRLAVCQYEAGFGLGDPCEHIINVLRSTSGEGHSQAIRPSSGILEPARAQ